MSICYNCKNLIAVNSDIAYMKGMNFCKYNNDICIESRITECSHFIKKPESHEEQNKEVKELMTKAPKEPRSRKNVKMGKKDKLDILDVDAPE